MAKEQIFAEATSVYDNYVEALETGTFEVLHAYGRSLSARIDTYTGKYALNWLDRWALTRGHEGCRHGARRLPRCSRVRAQSRWHQVNAFPRRYSGIPWITE